MCGIAGYSGHYTRQQLENGLAQIRHRGPDGDGVFVNEHVALGHRRLSIIDLSDNARQPFSVDSRYTITYNGEIYNYLELKKELRAHGVVFTSESDTEVLLRGYLHWGPDVVKRLNGMWAFCIYDRTDHSLFLSRDRMGKKPLFYSLSDRGFVFGSEMKAIYPFLDRIEVNEPVVEVALKNNFAYESTADCLIRHIQRFPAAHNGLFHNGQLKLTPYWDPASLGKAAPGNYATQKEQFRELFLDACRLRMRSDVPIGTALSGGLDSSAVICSIAQLQRSGNAKQAQQDWQHAFVATFPGTALDESHHAKTVTDHLRIPAHFLAIDPLRDLDAIFYKTYLFEELYYAPVIPFAQLYEKIKHSGVSVSIDGHGADELFAGYPFDMDAALIDSLHNPVAFSRVLKSINAASGKPQGHDFNNKLKYALLNRYAPLRKMARNLHLVQKRPGLDYLNSTLFHASFKTILPTLLRNYDRYSMMNGVEIRMPFLDHRIVEFAFSLPWSAKVRNGYGKAIVRDALADLIPKSIVYRKDKIGFNAPVNNWMNRELKTWIGDLLHSNSFHNSRLIDRAAVFKTVNATIAKPEISFHEGHTVFHLLTPLIWEKSLLYAR